MKLIKKIFLLLSFLFFFSYTNISSGLNGFPLGGDIGYWNPACTVGGYTNFSTTILNGPGSGLWMWNPKSLTYLYTPPLPKEVALGQGIGYAPCLTYCPTGICPAGPGGAQVIQIGTGWRSL